MISMLSPDLDLELLPARRDKLVNAAERAGAIRPTPRHRLRTALTRALRHRPRPAADPHPAVVRTSTR